MLIEFILMYFEYILPAYQTQQITLYLDIHLYICNKMGRINYI